ncbi:MAG: hypothetical protein WD826_09720 [Actinomycetota bacterium]
MQVHAARSKLRVIAACGAIAVAALWVPADARAQAEGPFSGSAATDLVHVHAVNVPDQFELAEVAVAPASAETDSDGVEGGGNAVAKATNIDVEALSEAIDEQLLVAAEHRAPSDEEGPVSETLVEIPADPLLNATIASVSAHSRWVDDGCVPVGTPISLATTELADANLITGTPAGAALAALHNDEGGTVHSKTTTEFVDVEGQEGKGISSRALTQLTAVRLFEGSDNELTVNVLAPPVVEAIATGAPGGADVAYSEPVLQVLDANGEVLGELNASDANQEIDALPLVKIRIGHLVSDVADDGTSAEGQAVLFEVIVLSSPDQIEPLARLSVAAGEVSASVPSGGVDCSIDDGGADGEALADVDDESGAVTDDTEVEAAVEVPVGDGGDSLPTSGAYVGTMLLIGSSLVGGGWFLRRGARAWLPDDLRP